MIVLFRLLARVPLPLLHRLGALLGWLVWWLLADLPPPLPGQRAQARASRLRRCAAGHRRGRHGWWPSCPGCGSAAGRERAAAMCAGKAPRTIEAALAARPRRHLPDAAPGLLRDAAARRWPSASRHATGRSRRCTGRRARPGCAELVDTARATAPGLQTLPTTLAGVRGQMLSALRAGGSSACCPTRCRRRGRACGRRSSAGRPTP